MSEVERVVSELDDRSRNGKTAQRLITAAEVDRHRADDEMAVLREEIDEAKATIDDLHQMVDDVNAAWREGQDEIKRLSQPRKATKVEGEAVEYRYTPAQESRDTAQSLWTLGELDSIIMHLRVAGAGDDTQVLSGQHGITASVRDDGQPVAGWVREQSPERSDWKIPRWYNSHYFPWWVTAIASLLSASIGFGIAGGA